MKTPSEWAREWCHPPTYTRTISRAEFEVLIEAIQRDALSDIMADTTAQEEFEITKATCEKLEMDVEFWKSELEKMRLKWHEARRYLRAANRGAERNAMVMKIQSQDISRLLKRIEQLEKRI